MIQGILGKKIEQLQEFLEDGTRIPVTRIETGGNIVVQIKKQDKEGYNAIQLGIGTKKKAGKPLSGHIKKTGIQRAPRFLREIRVTAEDFSEDFTLGKELKASEILKAGDIIDVMGISKGKGYAGVVKKHHFKGGPRTHGQSDRERAPGSIGQTTTPGRVYKGKRMSGRMGHVRVTVRNLVVVDVSEKAILVKGLVPGGKNNLLLITKKGEVKKFVPLYREGPYSKEYRENTEDPKEVVQVKPEEKVETKGEEIVKEQEEMKEEPVEAPKEAEVREENAR